MMTSDPHHPPTWTALVVEDEPRLRQSMVELLRASTVAWKDILQASHGEEALALCQTQRPDLAFLDIRLPGMSGLDLASRLPPGIHIIFVTAYDAHAIAAFEAGAVDYLLKPITPERMQKALDRIQARAPISLETVHRLMGKLAAPAPERPEPLRWITASSGKKTHLIPVDEVFFFQADSKYTRVECLNGSYIIALPIKELVAKLDPKTFQQVHRSTLVNLRAVAWLEKHEGEGATLHLRNHPAHLPVSAAFLRELKDGL